MNINPIFLNNTILERTISEILMKKSLLKDSHYIGEDFHNPYRENRVKIIIKLNKTYNFIGVLLQK